MATVEIYKLGVTSERWRCGRCRYAGLFMTRDSYKRGFTSARTYRGGFLLCPNPGCQKQGGFMKRRDFDRVARFYEIGPRYYEALADMRAAVASQFPVVGMERAGVLTADAYASSWSHGEQLESADR